MRRAIIIGQSHCNAIADAISDDAASACGLSIYRIGDPDFGPNGEPFTLGAALPLIAGLPSSTRIFLSLLGGYHNFLGLLQSGQAFDFFLEPSDVKEGPQTAHVPNRALGIAMEQAFDSAAKIHKLKAASKSPVYMLSSPPTKGNNDFITERLMAQKKKVYRGRSVAEFGVERPEIRRKLWNLEARLLADWTRRGGMTFVPAPGASFDEAGFLREEFYHDATHANARYGALVVQQIEVILRGEESNG